MIRRPSVGSISATASGRTNVVDSSILAACHLHYIWLKMVDMCKWAIKFDVKFFGCIPEMEIGKATGL